jgi:hypothetical protein
MLFHDITRETPYDIWIGDESWEVDYYLHENPELKCATYVFMTDDIILADVEGQVAQVRKARPLLAPPATRRIDADSASSRPTTGHCGSGRRLSR